MALVRTVLKPNLVTGMRCYDPAFKPTVKNHKSTLWNFTSDKVYKELLETVDKPPKMHSFMVPKYKLIRKWQAEAAMDVGIPAYRRWAFGALVYRVTWFFTIVGIIESDYKAYLIVKNVNDGVPLPPFML